MGSTGGDGMQLRRERGRIDTAMEAWVATLDAERLAASFSYRTMRGDRREHPLWWALRHFFNHQTNHRGQVTTLLSQVGIDPGVTDLIALMRP